MSARSLVVVTAGLSVPSSTLLLGERLAAATVGALRERGVETTVEMVEAREHALDLTNNLLMGFPSPRLKAVMDRVVAADGLIAVAPVYNASYSGLFKVFFDVLDLDSLAGVPVLLGATGGTARHSLSLEHALRPLFAYLGASTVPTAVFAAAEDWGASGGDAPGGELSARITRAGGELARAMAAREPRRAADPFADPVPFEELLRGS